MRRSAKRTYRSLFVGVYYNLRAAVVAFISNLLFRIPAFGFIETFVNIFFLDGFILFKVDGISAVFAFKRLSIGVENQRPAATGAFNTIRRNVFIVFRVIDFTHNL